MRATDRFSPAAARTAAVVVGIFLCGALCLAQAPGTQRKLLVADVLVRGNRRVSTQEIMALVRTRPRTPYSPEAVQEDVRSLMATRRFANVQSQIRVLPNDQVEVSFFIVDYLNVVEEVVYQGAKSLKASDLESITFIKKGAPMNPLNNQIACQTIVNRYREKGRAFASCTLVEGANQGDRRVVFSITEGPEVYIRDIRFVGNHFVAGPVLKTHLNSSSRFFGINLFSHPYLPVVVDGDVSKLIEYYRSFGYHDVKVSRQVEWNPGSKTVDVVFHIDEGLRYRVQALPQIVGNASFKNEELGRITQVRADEYYSQEKVEKDTKRLTDYYGHTGRRAAVEDRVVFTGPGQCAVYYEVKEQSPASVGQLFLVGNTTTRQNVILRQVPLFPGQPLSYPNVAQAERNLAKLGIFENNPETGVRPTVTVLDPESDSPYKDILINVQETRTGSLLFGVGFNSDAGATGSIVLNERNFDLFRFPRNLDDLLSGQAFRGAGQELRVEAVPGTQLQRYTIQFREPFLFDSPYSLSVGGYYYTRRFDEYDEGRLGSRITLGRRFGQFWTLSTTLRVEDIDAKQIAFGAPPDYLDVQGHNFLTSLRLGANRDTRDSYLRPTEGNVLDLSVEQATGDFTFPIFNADFNQYFTVFQRADGSGRHVVAFHSQLGYAGSNTPVFERFYAGGFRSLRGFQFRGVGPDDSGFKVGGDFLFLNSLEYQLPVTAGDNLYLVGFVDSGTVERTVEIKDYRVSAGVGVRFTVPMLGPVPIALDFGFPIVRGAHDRQQVFSFWLGFFR
ncbi:MAG: outer membrane protein assembly factor BamA [Planctomycetes bacterium]|nr:outer membrane protein assembly factor BamA [Planctomycetota bacterium]